MDFEYFRQQNIVDFYIEKHPYEKKWRLCWHDKMKNLEGCGQWSTEYFMMKRWTDKFWGSINL